MSKKHLYTILHPVNRRPFNVFFFRISKHSILYRISKELNKNYKEKNKSLFGITTFHEQIYMFLNFRQEWIDKLLFDLSVLTKTVDSCFRYYHSLQGF